MEINEELKKPTPVKAEKIITDLNGEIENIKVDDLNGVIEEVADTQGEQKAKEERERKLKETIQKQFVRVGDKYYKLVHRPDKHGRTQRLYVERQKSTIVDDFGRKSLKWVMKYEGFCCVASHTNFKQVIDGFFNEYNPLSHKPTSGNFDTIISILNHIFKDKIEFALDYLKLLYTNPTQRLPIILLESKEKNTGKSTFGNLLKLIFQDNAIKLGNSDFESDFNAIWIKSLCIIVDETSLDKKSIMPMLKRLSTETNKVTSNEKNKAQTQIDFIGKFLFMSNDEGKALLIERGDTRFAVFKVSTLIESGLKDNPNIEDSIQNEIPAFLDYLLNRKLHHSESGRMYFSTDVYFTKQLEIYFDGSQSYVAKAIQEYVKDVFVAYPEVHTLHFAVSDLIEQLSVLNYAKKTDRQQMKRALEVDLSIKPNPRQRYELYSLYEAENNLNSYTSVSKNNVVYEFKRDNFN
ncbi:DUF5906 domain-containing protein [Dyadobacter sp. LHD-138]|uniref:primase-helicase family protein n=1 Tax=Dyadobacter sp. LHD-138 TaxID=3071413 RepID=UPI0027E0703A|nr:DUF5906 domain-containing protein [Dyadobacter sp. LHD-138]MDQ6482352.1 DUF5906 domain-containing protein [Dyadobacter sp. LHD-138]